MSVERRIDIVIGICLSVIIITWIVMAGRPPTTRGEVITARAIRLVDDKGQCRAKLTMDDRGPCVNLYDADGDLADKLPLYGGEFKTATMSPFPDETLPRGYIKPPATMKKLSDTLP